MTVSTELRTASLVAVGAGLGAVARYICTDIAFLPLVVVNAVGCFLIAFVPQRFKPFCGTGFLGGFTSFSTFMLLTDSLLMGIASVIVFIGAWLLGDWVRSWL